MRKIKGLVVWLMESLAVILMEIIREIIVDLILPTQGHSSICNQVDHEYIEALAIAPLP